MAIDVLPRLHTWKLWPLWAGILIIVGSPLIGAALGLVIFLLFLPCALLQSAEGWRRQRAVQRAVQRAAQRAAVQMEEGRRLRSNQMYIDAANAAAVRPAPHHVAPPEEPSPAAVAEAETIEPPAPKPEINATNAISPPAAAHVDH